MFGRFHGEQGQSKISLKVLLKLLGEYPRSMRQLRTRHRLLFRVLAEHCLFLTRRQLELVLSLPTSSTNRELKRLVSKKYLARRYRADSFRHFQTPLYYLGELGWKMAGKAEDGYKSYRRDVEQRHGLQIDHLLMTYDVFLKLILNSSVKRIIGSEDKFWHESFEFGNIPDGWVQFDGGEAFIEVDCATERPAIVAQKFANYLKLKQSGNYRLMFPGCAFRVLFITTTEERIESLERLTTSDDIWFATMDEFLREPLDHQHWFALKGFYALFASPQKEVSDLRQADA